MDNLLVHISFHLKAQFNPDFTQQKKVTRELNILW